MKRGRFALKVKILDEIFKLSPQRFRVEDKTNKILSKKLKVNEKEIKETLEFLFRISLIGKTYGNSATTRDFDWEITEKGLDYLNKVELEEKQVKTNEIIAFTGSIIALTSIYGLLTKVAETLGIIIGSTQYLFINSSFVILITFCLTPLILIIFNFWRDILNDFKNK